MRLSCLLVLITALPLFAVETEKGKFEFKPLKDEDVPERYRLKATELTFELKFGRDLPISGFETWQLKFPSPVKSPYEENNTVYAEYFRPKGKGPFPAVVLLDILDGSQTVSRGIANVLAQNGIAGLIIYMPYYGPRRPLDSKIRMISPDVTRSMEAIRQSVLDNRCAVAWLASRPEIDTKRLGIHGTSLGSFVGAVTAAAEPRIQRVSLLLGGGGLVEAYSEDPRAKPFFMALSILGGTKEMVQKAIAPVDPITYAEQLKKKNLLMIAASRDDVVPPSAAKALWEATGKQKIVWFNATHVGAVVHLFDATEHIIKHFKAD
jgi:dienelactone hydrolase